MSFVFPELTSRICYQVVLVLLFKISASISSQALKGSPNGKKKGRE